ncbi:MAG: hypothetical protein GX585_00175 [Clostridiales bacterium]|nr:hypothetical protein [Clostridiales bacterium]
MPIEEIKRVTEAEKTAQERKSEAVLRTKKLIGDAERAGQAHLAAVRAEAQAQAKGFMAEAEAEAAKRAAAIAEETQAACDRLRAAAEQKLPEAAELIVGRVVSV